MSHPHLKDRRRAQKESLLMQEISKLFMRISMDDKELQGLFVNRVSLSQDKSTVKVFFYCDGGPELFEQKLKSLVLYKPSMRKAIAQEINARYTPELTFAFDHLFEKQRRVDELIDSVHNSQE